MSFAIVDQLLDLNPGKLFFYRQVLVDGRDVMVGGGDDAVGAEDFDSALFESFESLGAGDFVDEMFVYIQDRGSAFYGADDVAVPDLFE